MGRNIMSHFLNMYFFLCLARPIYKQYCYSLLKSESDTLPPNLFDTLEGWQRSGVCKDVELAD